MLYHNMRHTFSLGAISIPKIKWLQFILWKLEREPIHLRTDRQMYRQRYRWMDKPKPIIYIPQQLGCSRGIKTYQVIPSMGTSNLATNTISVHCINHLGHVLCVPINCAHIFQEAIKTIIQLPQSQWYNNPKYKYMCNSILWIHYKNCLYD